MGQDFAARQRRHSPQNTEEAALQQPLIVQRKLQVGASHDPHEREADDIADQVVRRLNDPTVDAGVNVQPAATRIRRSARGGSSADGFTAPAEVESGINAAKGGGAPIDSKVRSKFEGAMGTDLGNVRIHADESADHLNRAVSAKAFTTGNDVFFSKGTYNPQSSEGQHLLAHELAHTVQQGGQQGGTTQRTQRRTIRRMTVQNTDFSKTNYVKVFQKGGSGNVAEFSDGGAPIIVKVDQLIGHEVVAAGNLLSGSNAKNGASGGYQVKAPDSRIASPTEQAAIKAATLTNMKPTDDPRNFIKGLDSANPTIIAEKMSGRNFEDILKEDTHGTTDKKGKAQLDPDSIITQMVHKSGPLTTLGKAGVPDIMMGMRDRMIGAWNSQNFMYDEATKTFNFVDNTQNIGSGFITTVDLGKWGIQTSQDAFNQWCALGIVGDIKGNIPKLADSMFTTITGLDDFSGILGEFPKKKQPETYALLEAAVRKNKKKMIGYITTGLKAGLKTVKGQLKNPLALAAGIPAAKKAEVVQSMLAKGYFLDGMAAGPAWAKAGSEAAKLVPAVPTATPTTAMPPLPNTPPNTSATGGKPPQTGGTWKRATPRKPIGSHRG